MSAKTTRRGQACGLNFDRILSGTPRLVVIAKGKYRTKNVDKRHAGNPFILAMLSMPSEAAFIDAIKNIPSFNPAHRRLPPERRLSLLGSVAKLLVPNSKHVVLARCLWQLLVEGYVNRGIHTAASMAHMQRLVEAMLDSDTLLPFGEEPITQDSAGLAGPSGTGKTSFLRRITQLLPSVIYHEEHHLLQVPFLFIEMPFDGKDAHLLATSIFSELNRILPTEGISETFSRITSGNGNERLLDALNLCMQLNVGVLIIDEKQNGDQRRDPLDDVRFNGKHPKSSSKERPLTKRLITASNTAIMPIFFSGTLESLQLASTVFHSLNRRISGRGSATWMPHVPSFDLRDGHRGEFENLLSVLWQYQYTEAAIELTDEYVELFWDLTQGLPDSMVKLFIASQVGAISIGAKSITPELVEAAYANEFWASHFSLQALRGDDEVLANAAKDLYHPVITPIFRAKVKAAFAASQGRRRRAMSPEQKRELSRANAASERAQKEYHRGVELSVDARASTDNEAAAAMPRVEATKMKADLLNGSSPNTYLGKKKK